MKISRPFLFLLCLFSFVSCLWTQPVLAQTQIESVQGRVQPIQITQAPVEEKSEEAESFNPLGEHEFPWKRPSVITQAIALSTMSLMPFIMMLLTSFAKISIVLALLRNALGTQQAPPNQVINGISVIITLFIMFPTGIEMYEAARPVIEGKAPTTLISGEAAEFVVDVTNAAKEPYRDFLKRNTEPAHTKRFYTIAYQVVPEKYREHIHLNDFIVLVPAFVTTQLKDAFEIGVLIYLPFFIIDLVTSNILLAMGMMMLSPVTISLPLKIFLLVMLDGWTHLIHGLVLSYR